MEYKIINKIYKIAAVISLVVMAVACGKKEEPDVRPEAYKRVTVIYAVNRSSLASDFIEDCNEIFKAMPQVDLATNTLLLYKTDSETETGLYEISKVNGDYDWKRLKSYNRTTTSTEPGRMAEVLNDAVNAYKADSRTLFFWGHGSAWTPGDSDHQVKAPDRSDSPACYGYGGEYGKDKIWNWTDIDDLAEAIPAGSFDIIWFDCCYMASVEVAYELRDKARWFVAYPTEVWDKGLNYDAVLPLVMREKPNLELAASTFFKSYNDAFDPVTVTVMDLSKIEPLASAVNAFFKAYPETPAVTNGIVNYRRQRGTPYFDMMQLLRRRSDNAAADEFRALIAAIDNFIVIHLESPKNFSGNQWIDPLLCGVSMHNFVDDDSDENEYYKTLSWHRRVTE